jgi:Tfp pilus assembly protein PilF
VAYGIKNDRESSIADYNKAIELRPSYAPVFYSRGVAYHVKGEFDLAIADFTKAVQLAPRHIEAYVHRGRSYVEKQQYDRAIVDYAKAIEIKPDHAEAYYQRAVAFIRKDDTERALADLNKTIEINPGYVAALTARGAMLARKGEIDKALADLAKAVELAPEGPVALRWRGTVLAAKGDVDKAIADFQAVLRLPDVKTIAGQTQALAREGLAQLAAATAIRQRNRNSIAIVIGNSKYEHTTAVAYAQNDARAIRDYLINVQGFRTENVYLHLDVGREKMESLFGDPQRGDGELLDLVRERRLETRGDVFVFYSGHGVPDPDQVNDAERRAFLLPVDVRADRITVAAYPLERLQANLDLVRAQLPADRNVILMLDACFSGRAPAPLTAAAGGAREEVGLFHFSRGSFSTPVPKPQAGIVRLIAATGDQVAYWDEKKQLGLFTSLFLEAVAGGADGTDYGNGDGQVKGEELSNFLSERLPIEARLRFRRLQKPILDGVDSVLWAPTLPKIPAAAR